MDIKQEIENECDSTPSEKRKIMPSKSKERYESTYNKFKEWTTSHGFKILSENVLLRYFHELSVTQKYAPPTLWHFFSILNTTLKHFENIDIEKYTKLMTFLKRKNIGYQPKQTKVFETEEIRRFLLEAPDDRYLLTKAAVIFIVVGGCRGAELPNISTNNIQEQGRLLLVEIPKTKRSIPRSFTIDDPFVGYVKKYSALRPLDARTDRFFLNYQKGQCSIEVVGKNKFEKMPKEIATFLNLNESSLYTGLSIRRTSATLLANTGANKRTLHAAWKSAQVKEGHVENPLHTQTGAEKTISEFDFSQKNNIVDAPALKHQKTTDTTTAATTSMQKNDNNDLQATSEYIVIRNDSQMFSINNDKSDYPIINIQNCNVHIYNYE